MATIEKTGTRWRVRQFGDGKLRTVASCATKVEAATVMRRLEEEERARSSVRCGNQLTLGEILVRWGKDKVGTGNDPLHTAAAVSRLRHLTAARNWSGTAAVTALSVSDYRRDGGSPRTCAFLASVLRWSRDVLDQYVDPKALLALRPGRAGRKPSPTLLTFEQVSALESLAQSQSASAGALVHCLSTYGWRPITAARLRVSDLDLADGTITCSVKGGDVVRHPLLPETIARLRWLVAKSSPTEPLFIDPRSGKAWGLTSAGVIDQWSRNHLRTKVYDLKRYAISRMLSRGIPPQDIAAFTGHRTISQVLKYSRSNETQQRLTLEKMTAAKENDRSLMESLWKVDQTAPNPTK